MRETEKATEETTWRFHADVENYTRIVDGVEEYLSEDYLNALEKRVVHLSSLVDTGYTAAIADYKQALAETLDERAALEKRVVEAEAKAALTDELYNELRVMRQNIPVDWPTGVTGAFFDGMKALEDSKDE